MNGLKYIRTQCNLSLNELAEVLGISRQALSSWETNQKPLPEKRREQLAEFFGVDMRFIGEITDEDVQFLRDRVMFSYVIKDKEVRLFRPREGTKTLYRQYMTFADDSDITLDEKYARAKKRKQEALDKADEIIRYFDRCNYIQDKTSVINRHCKIYEALNLVMGDMVNKSIPNRMPYFHEIEVILSAMLLAYGFMSEEEALEICAKNFDDRYDDSEWLLSLAKMLKTHWDEKEQAMDAFDKEARAARKAQPPAAPEPPKTLEEEIAEYEAFCKDMRTQHGFQ